LRVACGVVVSGCFVGVSWGGGDGGWS